MENDNSSIESGANDIGGFEGSVSAEAPGNAGSTIGGASLDSRAVCGMVCPMDARQRRQ